MEDLLRDVGAWRSSTLEVRPLGGHVPHSGVPRSALVAHGGNFGTTSMRQNAPGITMRSRWALTN
jgi:hypothetical protein